MREGHVVMPKSNPNLQLADEQDFTAEELSTVDAIIERYRSKAGSLIPVLEDVQEALGYLPKSIQRKISLGLGVPFSEVYGVVTFYSFFTMAPRGRHTVKCCLGTACYVRGGKKILEKLSGTLGIEPGNTTADRRFSLETVRCLGACGLAPVITADDDTFRHVKPTKVAELLENYD
jgi:NADH:ubiquinone oxidoreductase subunit E